MGKEDGNRVGPRSWYWSTKTKVAVALAIFIAYLVIATLVSSGPVGDHP